MRLIKLIEFILEAYLAILFPMNQRKNPSFVYGLETDSALALHHILEFY